jgi:hypothetical protein
MCTLCKRLLRLYVKDPEAEAAFVSLRSCLFTIERMTCKRCV